MEFEQTFSDWIQLALQDDLQDDIKAFSFNLFEPAFVDGVKFGVELIGAREFDENDSDWACDEVWVPKQRQLNIPVQYSTENWESCLEIIKKLIAAALQSNKGYASKLKSRKAIGVGFVDGDLEIVWKP